MNKENKKLKRQRKALLKYKGELSDDEEMKAMHKQFEENINQMVQEGIEKINRTDQATNDRLNELNNEIN